MLFAYRYVPHKMEKMQQFIDFIFFAVWCKAPVRGRFGLHLFACNAQLHQVMWAFSLDDSKGANFFYGHIERIYKVFAALPTRDRHAIHRLKRWYRDNNAIERVCAADRATHLTRYINIGSMDSELSKQLGSFFKDLYSHVSLAALRAKIGDIDDHLRIPVHAGH